MKLINLNIWGGSRRKDLLKFLRQQREHIDIFCFQEVWSNANMSQFPVAPISFDSNIFKSISTALSDFNAFFASANSGMVGIAIFIRKSISVHEAGEMYLFEYPAEPAIQNMAETLGKKFQYIKFKNGKKTYTLCNFHGVWNKKRGLDTKVRIEQSLKIKQFLKKVKGAKILCGDYNLYPETKSMRILERDMINLVKKYNVKSTKNSLDIQDSPGRIVDYILVSPEIQVSVFEVIQENISDHMPLYLDFI